MKIFHANRAPVGVFLAFAFAVTQIGVFANPAGPNIQFGNINIQQHGDLLRIYQGTNQGVIEWNSFSIDQGQTVQFIQPGVNSATLNRVTGPSSSALNGQLLANGRVFLLNPNGILIGQSGMINVAGFTASTLDISDQNFLSGGDLAYRGNSQAAVVNLGTISAFDGDVFLVGAAVVNAGRITARRGTVGLAAGNDVLIAESGNERIFVKGASGGQKENGVLNKGTIEANIAELKSYGGNHYGMAVRNEGRVAATSVSREGGQIFLRAGGGSRVSTSGSLVAKKIDGGGTVTVESGPGGVTELDGSIDVSGEAGNGGSVAVLGEHVGVFKGGLIIADGETGGGSIYLGGGRRGQDPGFMNATDVTVAEGAQLSADAIGNGNGGEVIVFAENRLEFSGRVSAKGGTLSGDGGFVELSGKNEVVIPSLSRQIDLFSPNGMAGSLLIDPGTISIFHGPPAPEFDPGTFNSNTIADGEINSYLNSSGNLIIEAFAGEGESGDIVLQNMVDIGWSTTNRLSFTAEGDFSMVGSSTINGAGDLVIKTSTINLAGGTISSTGALTIEPYNRSSAINIGVGAVDNGLQLTDVEIGKLGDGFGFITIGNRFSGNGLITVNAVTFTDPTLLATPGFGGKIFVDGQITGADNASIILDGAGPDEGFGESSTTYLSADIVTHGNSIEIDDDVRVKSAAKLDTTGGGLFAGAFVDVYGTVDSFSGMEGAAPPQDFSINAGNGDIYLGGSLGDSDSLGAIDLDGQSLSLGFNFTFFSGVNIVSQSSVDIDVLGSFNIGGSSGITADGDVGIHANQAVSFFSSANGIDAGSGDIKIVTDSFDLAGGTLKSSGHLTVAPDTFFAAINIGVGAAEGTGPNPTLQLTDQEIGRFENGFQSITIGDAVSGAGAITVNEVTFNDPTLLATPGFGGKIFVNGQITGADNASITFDGSGPIAGFGPTATTYFAADVVTNGNDITIDDDAILVNDTVLNTTGGGMAAGANVTILGEVNGDFEAVDSPQSLTINAGTGGVITLNDSVGGDDRFLSGVGSLDLDARSINIGSGPGSPARFEPKIYINSEGSITVDVQENFTLGNNGELFAFDDITINANQGATSGTGNFNGIDIEGAISSVDGAIILRGTAGNSVGNSGVLIRDSTGIVGDLLVTIEGTAQLADGAGVVVGAPVRSRIAGVHVETNKGSIVIDGSLTANTFVELIGSSTEDTEFILPSNFDIDLIDGGGGGRNTINLSNTTDSLYVDLGFSIIDWLFVVADVTVSTFDGIDNFVGGSGTYRDIYGTSGNDVISVTSETGGSFEIPDGMGTRTMDFSGFTFIDGWEGDDQFVINSGVSKVFGGTVSGGDGSDDFRFVSGSVNGLEGDDPNNWIPGDVPGAVDTMDYSALATQVSVDIGARTATGVVNFANGIEIFKGGAGTSDEITGTSGGDVFTLTGAGVGTISIGMDNRVFSGFESLKGEGGADTFVMNGGSISSINGGAGMDVDALDFSNLMSQISVDLGAASATGVGSFSGIESFTGGSGTMDEFTGTSGMEVFSVTGAGSGTVSSGMMNYGFSGFEGLRGEGGADTFVMNGGSIGSIDGGTGMDVDALDFSNLMSQISVDLGAASATGVGSFSGIENLMGGSGGSALFGTAGADDFTINSANGGTVSYLMGGGSTTAAVAFTGFEELYGVGGDDDFLLQPTGTIGALNGGNDRDTLNFSAFTAPITANFDDGTATGVGEIAEMEVIIGGAGSDNLIATPGNDIFTITADNQGTLNSGEFFDIENLFAGGGSDQFLFTNQATVSSIDGGFGFDLLQLDDRNLTGTNTYTIGTNTISRNPTYTFSKLEALTLLLGNGDDTVVTAGNGLVITVDAGGGIDSLELTPAQFITTSPISIGGSTIFASGFEGPFDPVIPSVLPQPGGNGPNGAPGSQGDGGEPPTGPAPQPLAGLTNSLGSAFSSIVTQTVVLSVGGGQAEIQAPVSLDGTYAVPPLIVASNLQTSLQPLAWSELATAIGFAGPIVLVSNDGPFSLDLSSLPPELLVPILEEGIKSESHRELSAALGLTLVIPITSIDGVISMLAIPVPANPATLAVLMELVGPEAYSELTSALGE